MEKSYSASYAAAGVDITAGYKAVDLMKQHVARTMNEHCIGGLGGFGGLFELDCTDMPQPVLISGTDGVGTKLRIAQYMNKHDTVGIDCVAMCVNDVICAGAKPLVFLDYIACGKNVPERIAELVAGVAEGCVQAGCALVGGETAEMPGFYPEDEYDLAGFTVGAVDKSKILDNSTMQPGDVIIALPSTGVHSNGFSLVRKIFDLENNPDVLKKTFDGMDKTLGEALLAPTKIYVKPVLAVMKEVTVKGVSHITGGGFYENIPRSLKAGCCAVIKKSDVRTPVLFDVLAKEGNIPERDMFNTFNMGTGMVLVAAKDSADKALAAAQGGVVAFVGIVMLFWAVVRVFGSVEEAFNNIWEVKVSRSFTRQFTDYIAVVVITPILWVVGSTAGRYAGHLLGIDSFGALYTLLSGAVSLLGIWAMFSFIYVVVPNTRVRLGSAVMAGIVAGTLFLAFQWGYVWLQRYMTSYNAIYGSFAALPLFLIWVQWSWQILLFGGELAFAYQNISRFAEERESLRISYDHRRQVTLAVMLHVARIFRDGVNADRYGEDYLLEERTVTAADSLAMPMAPGGGYAVQFERVQ